MKICYSVLLLLLIRVKLKLQIRQVQQWGLAMNAGTSAIQMSQLHIVYITHVGTSGDSFLFLVQENITPTKHFQSKLKRFTVNIPFSPKSVTIPRNL